MRADLERNMRELGFDPSDRADELAYRIEIRKAQQARAYQKRKAAEKAAEKHAESLLPQAQNKKAAESKYNSLTTLPFFPESSLSLQEKTSARARVAVATLTDAFMDYARKWSNWDDERIARQFELCRAHYAAYMPADSTAEIWPLWQAWVQRGHERQEREFEVGTLAHAVREKRQVEAVLGAMANGQVQSRNGSGMRQPDFANVPTSGRTQSASLGGGNGNVVHGTFGGSGQERDKYGYPKAQTVSDSGAPRRVADGRNRAD